jgi:hypothetical protein
MYGNQAPVISQELAEQRASTFINSARAIFNREPISGQYQVFIEHALESIDQITNMKKRNDSADASQIVWKKGASKTADKYCNNE